MTGQGSAGRDGVLHVARAGAGPARRRAIGHLQFRLCAVRDVDGATRVPERQRRRRRSRRFSTKSPRRSIRRQAPRPLSRLLAKCLRKHPADRWQHMSDVKQLLDDLATDDGAVRRRGRRRTIGERRPRARVRLADDRRRMRGGRGADVCGTAVLARPGASTRPRPTASCSGSPLTPGSPATRPSRATASSSRLRRTARPATTSTSGCTRSAAASRCASRRIPPTRAIRRSRRMARRSPFDRRKTAAASTLSRRSAARPFCWRRADAIRVFHPTGNRSRTRWAAKPSPIPAPPACS